MTIIRKSWIKYLFDKLGFNLVDTGVQRIGNSGPLPDNIVDSIQKENLYAVSVLSGNRNLRKNFSSY